MPANSAVGAEGGGQVQPPAIAGVGPRRDASAQAEREYRRDAPAQPVGSAETAALEVDMARFEALRRAQALFEACMGARGYVRAKGG